MRANYDLAILESIRTLKEYDVLQVPINLELILKAIKRTVRTCSYSKFAIKSNMTISQTCDYFDSKFGVVAYLRAHEKYVIYYNDTFYNTGLTRFTIAHELGHIFLNHHQDANTDILLRENISKSQYDKFEREANCFARNLLSPIPLVERITDIAHPQSANEIMEAFDISYKAAHTRKNLYSTDKYRITSDDYIYFNKYRISYGYYCFTCDSAEIDASDYCKICGNETSIFERKNDRIFYPGIAVNQNKRVVKCPECENITFSKEAQFCKICGTRTYNVCEGIYKTNTPRAVSDCYLNPTDGNARYCSDCSSKTTFYVKGFLSDWETIKNNSVHYTNTRLVAEKEHTTYKTQNNEKEGL